MLDLDASREAVPPRDASTLVLLRDAPGGGVEVFCVERNKKTGFMGGAVVFPGGKLDERDKDPAWSALATPPRPAPAFAPDEDALRALAIAACRETLEEAAILPLDGARLSHDELLALRARVARPSRDTPPKEHLLDAVRALGVRLDLAALHPAARWITPAAESRRFDTRFYVARVAADERGLHDAHETMASFWARPAEVVRRFLAGELQLAPPTHRTLEILASAASVDAALAETAGACLEPICPRLVPHKDARGDTFALVLPGDPEHELRELRSPGKSRYVLRGDRFLPEDPPA